jgi:hypothetical protein
MHIKSFIVFIRMQFKVDIIVTASHNCIKNIEQNYINYSYIYNGTRLDKAIRRIDFGK